MVSVKNPNVIFVFSDQHRAQSCGYTGDPNVKTPNMDRLAQEGINLTNAISTMPVCCPYRASLITGQYAHQHGIFLNDVCLSDRATSIAQAFGSAGYDTAYIGKWHLDGHGRSAYIPPERRQGFDYWSVLECTHDYNHSQFYHGNDETPRIWDGYDAIAQTDEAIRLIENRNNNKPLLLMLSWGSPHNPYETAPEEYQAMYRDTEIVLRENVPFEHQRITRKELAGYYAHITALDDCLGRLMAALKSEGMEDDTIFVYTSDHGDMLHSQGVQRKQSPWDESIKVPFLLRYPNGLGRQARMVDVPFGTPDIMPTLLDLCGIDIPKTVSGESVLSALNGEVSGERCALIQSIQPFAEWHKFIGGREYRGIRTRRYTYVRDLYRPWLLYDNQEDPYQIRNLLEEAGHEELRARLDKMLDHKLESVNDQFLSGKEYVRHWGYQVDITDTVVYTI